MEELSILELASKGGWIMIVLAVLSVIASTIAATPTPLPPA